MGFWVTLTLALSLRERGFFPQHRASLDSCLRRNDGCGVVGRVGELLVI